METRRLAAPSIGRPGRANRGLALLLGAAAAMLLIVVAIVAALSTVGGGSGSSLRQPVGSPTSSASSRTPVQLRAADFVGRPLAAVQTQLTTLGLKVQPRPITTGAAPAGQVIAVDPVGTVVPGQTLVVTYAVAPPVATPGGNGHGKGRADGEGD